MAQLFLVGIAAGAASALLVASVLSLSSFALVLYCFATLPILIAAIGWSHLTGLIAAFVAAAALAAILGGTLFLPFLVGTALPAWWLGYLALLARPAAQPTAGSVEWYPAGRLVMWTALLSAAAVSVGLLNVGFDAESIRGTLKRVVERMLRIQLGIPVDAPLSIPGTQDPNRLLDGFVAVMPPLAAMTSALTNLVNLWIAGRIVKALDRLQRPWPDLAAMRLPPIVAAAFAIAIAGTFVSGLVNIIAGVFAAALMLAYAIVGFAIVHKLTAGVKHRGFILAGVCVIIAVVGSLPLVITLLLLTALLAMLLGLADAVVDIRERFATKPGPPAPRT
jgi:hypothetical protein